MALYRVGASGATVVAPDGTPLTRLEPGSVVVPGRIESPADFAAYLDGQDIPQVPERVHDGKRIRGYADKRLTAYDDKRGGLPSSPPGGHPDSMGTRGGGM